MAGKCSVCGKGTISGNRKRHKHSIGWKYEAPKTKRKWKANLRTTKVNGKRVVVCMKCYKKLKKEGRV